MQQPWNHIQSAPGFTTFGTRAVDYRTCFDMDEDRRQLLCEVLRKMIGAIDRCTARMDRIFEDMKMPCVSDDEFPEGKSSVEVDFVKEEEKRPAKDETVREEKKLDEEAVMEMSEQIEQNPSPQSSSIVSFLEGAENGQNLFTNNKLELDRSKIGGEFQYSDGGMKGKRLGRHGGFNREVNYKSGRYRAEEVEVILMFDPGIRESNIIEDGDWFIEGNINNFTVQEDRGKDYRNASEALLREIPTIFEFLVASMLPPEALMVVQKSISVRKLQKGPNVYPINVDVHKLVYLEPRTWEFDYRLEQKFGCLKFLYYGSSADLMSIMHKHQKRNVTVISGEVDSCDHNVVFDKFSANRKPRLEVVGSGLSRMFAALVLTEVGADVTLVEKGKVAEQRGRYTSALAVHLMLQVEGNFCFGEGGARTRSDGMVSTFFYDLDVVVYSFEVIWMVIPFESEIKSVETLGDNSSSSNDGYIALFICMLGLDNDPSDIEHIVVTLWKYSLGGQHCDNIKKYQMIITLVVDLLKSELDSTCGAVAGLLRVLSSIIIYRDLIAESGVKLEITALLTHSSLSSNVKEQTICIIWNLSVGEKFNAQLNCFEIFLLLIKYLEGEDVKIKESAGKTLANLIPTQSNHKLRLENGLIPKLAKLFTIDGTLIIRSVLASEKAMAHSRNGDGEICLAVHGDLVPAVPGQEVGRNGTGHFLLRALDAGVEDIKKSTTTDGRLQQCIGKGMYGLMQSKDMCSPMLSAGMSTEVFQFEASVSCVSGAIVPSSGTPRNISEATKKNSMHPSKTKDRRILSTLSLPESSNNIFGLRYRFDA